MPQYEVQPGDTLYDIAQKTTGDGNRWREIYDNNKTTIGSDPGMIHAGQVYSIPYDQAAVNEGNSMGYGSQSQGDYAAPSIQPYNSQRYPDPNRPSPDTSSYSPTPSAGMSPSSGAPTSQPQSPPAVARSLTRPQQGPPAYTPQVSADRAFQQLSPREQMAKQVAPDQRAQMGVQITPPLQQGLNDWQQRLERNQRLGVPDTSPSPQVHPLQARPAQGYGPTGGSAGPQSNQQLVQWPAPPNPVGPQSYQGRFQDNTGAPRTIDAYHGYMGRPFQGSSQPQTQPQQAQPKAVIVIQADGSAIVYDPATGQWRQQSSAPSAPAGPGGKAQYSQIPQTVPMDTVGSPVNYTMPGVQQPRPYGSLNTLPMQAAPQMRPAQERETIHPSYYDVVGGSPPSVSDRLRELDYPPYGMRGG